MPAHLTAHTYGKARVRLSKLERGDDRHEFIELAVDVDLEGDFADTYLTGDNAAVVATDSMRNTVYALSSDGPVGSAEAFALRLASHFAGKYGQVAAATATVRQERWERLDADGRPGDHPHAFVSGGADKRLAVARAAKDVPATLSGGVENLAVVKTSGSAFAGYVRDEFATLPETDDRVMGTVIDAAWHYAPGEVDGADHDATHLACRGAMLAAFAGHRSDSVQQTLFHMASAVLGASDALASITLSMPNRHRIPFDLSKLGRENRNEVFVTTDEPYGRITATVSREGDA